jgi:hypothetical protein
MPKHEQANKKNKPVGARGSSRLLHSEHMLCVDHVEIPVNGHVWATEKLVLVNLRAAKCGLFILAHAIIESCSQQ